MKTSLSLSLSLCLSAFAQQFGLAWDPSPTPQVTYRLYCHTNSLADTNLAPAVLRLNVGTNTTARLAEVAPGLWFYRVTAVATNAVESIPSNEVAVFVPAPPPGLRLVVEANALDLSQASGWTNLGFFRLRLQP